ncbi:MAG: phosphoglycerate mutase [Pelagibacteraceae bacterium BACL5 MAG-120820-bin39]|jgi:phosphohistidine phosphatase SixA|uniref:histidine phosphatase family protein n=1 Tax=Candidatus Pelagibacter sp. TaxID=2024849 RepID=UPI00071552E3|nr:MAG: phosphoglycerate mutase [Pelagibacteraceae bacterium BACL5 MAG-121015-bin10]KRO64590.1 MAG: phosphoglycerate mutase [Pelagibacteraceae bacterium BACL5 MAG-120820-bin39]
MKILKLFLLIFISISFPVKADLDNKLEKQLKKGGNLIFIRHAYAPGGGDPENFIISDCSTQRNLNEDGKNQSKRIGQFFIENDILIDKVLSSEWCRCKDTAQIAFTNFETKNFLNSFFSAQFASNKNQQIRDLKKYIKNWQSDKNLVLITHYVLISEILNYTSSSGEIIISDKNFKVIDSFKIEY